ncbi:MULTISPECIES: hypothetical protein [Cellulophaga]|uniref:Uncharacterized protein n=1 Tax=Cellulophaga baltica 18 TaxID=1348584 RepID=A0AAU8RD64_9FLAO|nr:MULTISPECIES: hypothetical protein [Cellulophaga]AIZ40843.1 hypothetical protein M666_04225 [Cellulophaga baltica 18]KGK31198.1 hypothetical protein EL45_05860 [Cellulophaga sp. E6(2014)]MCR1025651.1 hypothetical protein [Cellulophaga baltica]
MKNLLKSVFNKRPDAFDAIPESVCPNCWGDQEYGNVIREKYRDIQIEVNNKERKHAFIQDFIVTNLSGIRLKSTVNGLECPTCQLRNEN